MTEGSKIPCPRCGQDWLQRVRLVRLNISAVLCRECDALWVDLEPAGDNFDDYATYMRGRGVLEPEMPSEIELLGPVSGPRPSPG